MMSSSGNPTSSTSGMMWLMSAIWKEICASLLSIKGTSCFLQSRRISRLFVIAIVFFLWGAREWLLISNSVWNLLKPELIVQNPSQPFRHPDGWWCVFWDYAWQPAYPLYFVFYHHPSNKCHGCRRWQCPDGRDTRHLNPDFLSYQGCWLHITPVGVCHRSTVASQIYFWNTPNDMFKDTWYILCDVQHL